SAAAARRRRRAARSTPSSTPPRKRARGGGPPRPLESLRLAAAERQVRLGRKRRNPDPWKVETPLVDDEAALPAREELPIEEEQVVELEAALQPQERATLEPLQLRELRLGREQSRERREVQGPALEAVLARPRDGLRHEPFVEAVWRRPQPRHRGQRERRPATGDGEVQEPGRGAVRATPDDEERVL